MIRHDDPFTLSATFRIEPHELAEISSKLPSFMASRLADKFVEENWPRIKSNKKIMADVQHAVAELAASQIAEFLTERVAEALGVNDD